MMPLRASVNTLQGSLATACALASLLAACDSTPSAPSPQLSDPDPVPASPAAPPGQVRVFGVVYEHTSTGRRPLPRLRFKLMHPEGCCAYSSDDPGSEATSDAAARFTIFVPVTRAVVLDLSAGSGYHAPCPSGFDRVDADRELIIDVVSDATLSTAGLPRTLPFTFPNVRGTVVERSPDGTTVPLAGVSVWLSEQIDSALRSTSLTDTGGNFLLCTNPPGTGTDTFGLVSAGKAGYRTASQSVFLGWDDRISLELVRD
jgi:hypothetical protein